MQGRNLNWKSICVWSVYSLLIYFQVFHHIDFFPLISWDESLFGMRMLQIAEEGEYLTNFDQFQGMGHSNSKPPFITLVQVFFYHLFGDSQVELAMRLPSALGTAAFLLFLPYFSQKKMGDFMWGLFAGLIMLGARGYNTLHVGKTGDHDAPLAILMVLGLFCFYFYTEAKSKKERNIYLAVLTFSLLAAYLTKNVMGFVFVIGFVIYAALKGELLPILKRRSTYIALAVLALSVLAYQLYLTEVVSFRHGRLHFSALNTFFKQHPSQTHDHPWDYYLLRLMDRQFYPFIYLIPIGLSVVFNKHFPVLRDITLLAALSATAYFLTISISVTKLEWYDAALYPVMAMLSASGLYMMWRALGDYLDTSPYFSPALKYILVALLMVFPYYYVASDYHLHKLLYPNEKFAYIMDQINRKSQIKSYYLSAPFSNPHTSFYAGYYNKNKDYSITLVDSTQGFEVGDHVLLCHDEYIAEMKAKYQVRRVDMYDQCRFYIIEAVLKGNGEKEPERIEYN